MKTKIINRNVSAHIDVISNGGIGIAIRFPKCLQKWPLHLFNNHLQKKKNIQKSHMFETQFLRSVTVCLKMIIQDYINIILE